MISITLDRTSYNAGEDIVAEISVNLRKAVKARGLFAELECHETHKDVSIIPMDQYDYDRLKELSLSPTIHLKTRESRHTETIYKKEIKLSGEGEYSKGSYIATFKLPKDAKPTSYEFGHDNKIHIWALKVKLDIPWAIDKNAKKEVTVNW